uniref:Probable tRNA sulfurtransferase n=1 Tax=Fervidobacterium thailandense TaxID=1008305 RepID=A0A7C4RXA6_9BACT
MELIERVEPVFILRYAEIGLKGKNREFFEKKLIDNVLSIVRPAAVNKRYGRIVVRVGRNDPNKLEKRLRYVFGIQNYSYGWSIPHDYELLKQLALEIAKEKVSQGFKTFKISAKRGYKEFPKNSLEINREVGALVLQNFPQLTVDVHDPEFQIGIDVREREVLVFTEKHTVYGGLPVGVSGKALLLLSGGIDSPVAGWYAMKRGLEIQTITFLSPPMTTEKSVQKILDLGKVLARYLPGTLKMWIIPFTPVQMYIKENAPDEYSLILQRRSMMRIATMLARRNKLRAIITGETLGQVASQTLSNMAAIEDASGLVVLRPLIGFDKLETTRVAKEIGTFEISILPYIDSCVAFAPKHPATSCNINSIREIEKRLEKLPDLEYEVFKKRELFKVSSDLVTQEG